MANTAQSVAERVALVQQAIAAACARAGRAPDAVTLVAVSKTHPATQVAEVAAVGVSDLGENRVEEAIPKMAAAAALTSVPLRWHLIGHLQSRKARYAAEGFALFHALDSVRLAGRINPALVEKGAVLDVLLEMNVSGEASKEGWHATDWRDDAVRRAVLWSDVRQVLALPGLRVRGLMTMAPIVDDPEQARPVFAALRTLRDALAHDFPGARWDSLSMGMSDDYPVAVEEGATLVRVGRAIFGPRGSTA